YVGSAPFLPGLQPPHGSRPPCDRYEEVECGQSDREHRTRRTRETIARSGDVVRTPALSIADRGRSHEKSGLDAVPERNDHRVEVRFAVKIVYSVGKVPEIRRGPFE